MANKIIKVPVSDVDGLSKDGGYSLRYRVVSKDGNRKSQWSEIVNIKYANSVNSGQATSSTLSFYERISSLNSAPILAYYNDLSSLDPNNYLDPHTFATPVPYDVSQVNVFLDPDTYIKSIIKISDNTNGLLEYSWDSLEKYAKNVQQKFDVYLSFEDSTGWSAWSFAGTTTSNIFSFTSPTTPVQRVQAAVFLSAYPKLDNIYGEETNFVSISPTFNVYRDSGPASLTIWSGSAGHYTATLSGLAEPFPLTGFAGRRVYADTSGLSNDRAAFGEAMVTVKSRATPPTNTVILQSNILISGTASTVHNISLV